MNQTLKLFGPPGTGKTSEMLALFETELKGIRPDRLAFLTFTRAARLEALGRSGRTENELPFCRTIHSICYRQLGIIDQQLLRQRKLKEFGQTLGIHLTGNVRNAWEPEETIRWERPSAADRLLQLNHVGRHRLIHLKEALRFADADIELKYAKWFTEAYRRWKTLEGVLDFTDLLTDYLTHGQPLDIDVLFVDEAQDLSKLQWQVVEKLGAYAQRTYLAGDDDQAIFAWAGAEAKMFIERPADEERVLRVSYRLPRAIHATASKIVNRIRSRYPKEFSPREEEGEVRSVGKLDPTILSHPGRTFILYRNHVRGRALAIDLEQLSWPFLGDHSVLSDKTVALVVPGWINALKHQPLTAAQARAIIACSSKTWVNREIRFERRALVAPDELFVRRPREEDWHQALYRLPGKEFIARCVRFHGWDLVAKPRIELLSIHQAKGREADTVILDTELTRKTFDSWLSDPDDEHRTWYVGVTRAKERLLTLLPESDLVYQL